MASVCVCVCVCVCNSNDDFLKCHVPLNHSLSLISMYQVQYDTPLIIKKDPQIFLMTGIGLNPLSFMIPYNDLLAKKRRSAELW